MSDRPEVSATTERLYATLPELYRDADATQDTGTSNYPLLRYLSLLVDQAQPLEDLLDRFSYEALDERDDRRPWDRYGSGEFGEGTFGDANTADLVDPLSADGRWLPWLAQLVGVDVADLSVEEQRAAIANPSATWAHGTAGAIAAKVRPKLTGSQYVDVQPHYQGNPFVIALITKEADTYGATTWGELEAAAPTWGELEAVGTWDSLEVLDVMVEAVKERPAGYRLQHVYLEDL